MRLKSIEVAIIVQKQVVAFYASGGNKCIYRLSNRYT